MKQHNKSLKTIVNISVIIGLTLLVFEQDKTVALDTVSKYTPAIEIEAIKTPLESKLMPLDNEYYLMLYNNYPWEVCDLTFYSYRHKKDVTAPQWFRELLYKYHDCGDQLLLTKIAHYESDFNPDSVNLINSYAKGLYHVLPTTRIECSSKYGIIEESDCALWVIKNYPSWYLDGYRPYGYDRSFK
jgi:hypothetical protein